MKNIKSAVVYLIKLREIELEEKLDGCFWYKQQDKIRKELIEVRNFLYNGKEIKLK